jgi:hypothetical protein
MTDEGTAYKVIADIEDLTHDTVKHSRDEYVRYEAGKTISTNTVALSAASKRPLASLSLYLSSSFGATMIKTPYSFEAELSDQEFQKIGQFACRWSVLEHQIGNCLRRLLDLTPKQATSLVFPLSLDVRMQRIEGLVKSSGLSDGQVALFQELKPLIKAMRFLRTSVLHGIFIDLDPRQEGYFHLRSKDQTVTKSQLFGCEDLINYTAHITQAFRLSLGEKDDPKALDYALPRRPQIPSFLRIDPKGLPPEDEVKRGDPPQSSPV